MSNIQTGAERMPHALSHLGFLAGQIGRLITISTTPVIAGDSFEMDAVGALRLSPLRRGLAIVSTVDIFTFYVPHRHVYGEQWIKFMKDGVNATPLPTVNTTGYIDHADFIGIRVNRAKKSGMVNITSSANSREKSGINTILNELNPLFTINVTMRDIKSKNVYSRVNSKATTQWRKTESANGVHLEGVASDNRSS